MQPALKFPLLTSVHVTQQDRDGYEQDLANATYCTMCPVRRALFRTIRGLLFPQTEGQEGSDHAEVAPKYVGYASFSEDGPAGKPWWFTLTSNEIRFSFTHGVVPLEVVALVPKELRTLMEKCYAGSEYDLPPPIDLVFFQAGDKALYYVPPKEDTAFNEFNVDVEITQSDINVCDILGISPLYYALARGVDNTLQKDFGVLFTPGIKEATIELRNYEQFVTTWPEDVKNLVRSIVVRDKDSIKPFQFTATFTKLRS